MHYLTVHDLVWINAIVLGKSVSFDYVKLEEAIGAQYNYGSGTDLHAQASNLLRSLITKPPFSSGNLRTAFSATAAFIQCNGWALTAGDEEAVRVMRSTVSGETTPEQAVSAMATQAGTTDESTVSLRQMVAALFNHRAGVIKQLAEED